MTFLQYKLNRSFLTEPSNGFTPHSKLEAKIFQWPIRPRILLSVSYHHSLSHCYLMLSFTLSLFHCILVNQSPLVVVIHSRDTYSSGSLNSLFLLLIMLLLKLSVYLIPHLLVLSSDITF